MADEVHELVVEMRPEGIDETTDGLEDTSEQFEETAETAGDSAAEMEAFSEKWQGALQAAVAGLAIAAAGLLSQVPIIGEAMAGLGAILSAIAFQIDKVLRPILTPVANKFFEWANAIFEAEGALGTTIGVAGTIISILAIVGTIVAGVAAQFLGWGTVLSTFIVIVKVVIGLIGAVVGAIASVPVIIALAIAAILAFAVAWIFNIGNVRQKTWDFVDAAINAFNHLKDVAAGIADTLLQIWINNAKRAANVYVSIIQTAINTALQAVPQEFRSKVGLGDGVDLGTPFSDVPALAGIGGGGGGGGGGSAANRPGGEAPTRQEIAVKLDGRRVDEGVRKRRDDKTSVRGRFG